MKVLIVGGGIGGLAAGIALHQRGCLVEVFERTPVLGEAGAGISLWANAIRALDALHLGESIRALGMPAAGGLRRRDGRQLTTASDALLRLPDFCLVVHRAELQSMLAEALGAERLRLNAAVEHFGESPDGVWLELESGIRVYGDVLVGADGLRSMVRATLHGDSAPVYAGYTAWRGVAPLPAGGILAGETWGAGCRFGQVPLRRERVYWFATKNAAQGARSPDGEQRALLRLFRGWHPPIETLIASTPEQEILRNDIYDRPPLTTPWSRGRMTLLGDAAHPMTPNLGQGACQALEDAVVLAQSVSASLHGAATPAEALATYERLRRPRVEAIVRQSRHVGRIAQWQHPAAVRLRDFLVSVMPPRVQKRQLEAIVGYDVRESR